MKEITKDKIDWLECMKMQTFSQNTSLSDDKQQSKKKYTYIYNYVAPRISSLIYDEGM